ncbi:hypothetical protein [Streptomyces sp. NBC_01443]|uniref:hypothetical protein n=1 Tax=Streptomyces sp. NBC_01443 TaxID=2903868 RepID=UPI002258FD7A|nr:hypothetical protein [Streptomyces sp. NBC_01443]MCX4625162.1 hypothetical protein [Streptomyces sp. NBC_01443]MCX4633527.1 hypothetical protein [Streptomyces sp. NBC_01443]
MATTKAAAEVGITTAAVYQRRRRDGGFAAAMHQAAATRSSPEPAHAATDVPWTAFYEHLAANGVVWQAALAAGIRPEAIHDRRRGRCSDGRRSAPRGAAPPPQQRHPYRACQRSCVGRLISLDAEPVLEEE